MANDDVGVGISIQSDVKDAANGINNLNAGLEKTLTLMNNFKPYYDTFNRLTLGIKRMSEVNTKRLNDNLEALTPILKNFFNALETSNIVNFDKSLNTLSYTVERFNTALQKLNNAKLKLPDFTNLNADKMAAIDFSQMDRLYDSVTKLQTTSFSQVSGSMDRLVTSFERLQNLKFNSNMDSSINSQMTRMAETLKTFMSNLDGFNIDGISRIAKSLTALPKSMEAMKKLDVSTIGKTFDTLTEKLHSFLSVLREGLDEINSFATILTKLGGSSSRGSKTGLESIRKEISNTGSEADKTRRKLSNMLSFGKMYAFYNQIRHYGDGFMRLLTKSIDFAEIENYFSRAMGNMRAEAMKFQETLAETFGMATPEMMQAQATFKNMIGSLGGIDDQTAYGLSERITKMVLDYSSLYNTTINSAITKFQAAISKQVRPIRSTSGYDITQKVLESTAQLNGIYDRSISQMGEMEKRLLIILTLQSQMARSAAMGDFARTIKFSGFTLRSVSNNLVNANKSGVVTLRYC